MWLHGTDHHGLDRLKASPKGLFGSGVYLTNDAYDAQQYGSWLAVVSANVSKPFITKADYSIAEKLDVETPAGGLILDVFDEREGAKMLKRLRHSEFGLIGTSIQKKLESMGHDSILVEWPGGLKHLIVFDPDLCQIEDWIECSAPIPG